MRAALRALFPVTVATLAIASFLAAGPATPAGAAPVSVTNCNDSGAGSLRQVVTDAISGDKIVFALSPACNLITLTSGEITIATSLTISGPGPGDLAVSGDDLSRIFVVHSGLTAIVSGLTVEDGRTAGALGGGGIFNEGTLTLSDVRLSGNTALKGGGGGIYNEGTLTITHSTVSGNTVSANLKHEGYGGGIDNWDSLTLTESIVSRNRVHVGGGGIFSAYVGPLSITDSTVSGNRATKGPGGGIYVDNGPVTLADSTVSDNHANNSEVGWGGAIYNIEDDEGSLTIIHATLSGNTAADGGGIFDDDATATLEATIVADSGTGLDCQGGVTDGGYNLDDDGSCGFSATSLSDTPADLDPAGLAHNGGPTPTIALEPGSAARGAVASTSFCGGQDQRGVPRPSVDCDIGAYQSALAIGPPRLAKATVRKAYAATLSAEGGTEPYTWKLSAGQLPAGISLSPSGTISGKPTAAGRYSFTVEVSDASTPALSAIKTYSMRVAMIILPSKLPDATAKKAYSTTLRAAGGKRPYRWEVSSGHLPAGLSLSPSGNLSGTPVTAGTYSFSVLVSDASSPAHAATRAYSLTVA